MIVAKRSQLQITFQNRKDVKMFKEAINRSLKELEDHSDRQASEIKFLFRNMLTQVEK